MWIFMVDVPCKRENLSYGENRALFYQPVQELWHFSKNPRWRTFFQNLRVLPTINFWRCRRTCSRRKTLSFIYFFAKFWLMTILWSPHWIIGPHPWGPMDQAWVVGTIEPYINNDTGSVQKIFFDPLGRIGLITTYINMIRSRCRALVLRF